MSVARGFEIAQKSQRGGQMPIREALTVCLDQKKKDFLISMSSRLFQLFLVFWRDQLFDDVVVVSRVLAGRGGTLIGAPRGDGGRGDTCFPPCLPRRRDGKPARGPRACAARRAPRVRRSPSGVQGQPRGRSFLEDVLDASRGGQPGRARGCEGVPETGRAGYGWGVGSKHGNGTRTRAPTRSPKTPDATPQTSARLAFPA